MTLGNRDGITLELKGTDALIKRLEAFGDKMQAKIVLAGLGAGARLVRKAASKAAPRRGHGALLRRTSGKRKAFGLRAGGYLSRHIVAKRVKGRLAYHVGPSQYAFYGRFLEEGTRHMRARPWLAPAFESASQQATNKVSDIIEKRIAAEARKLGSGRG